MKRTVLLLTLTLGLSALSASAQSQGDQARQQMNGPAPDEKRDAEVRERGPNPRLERRREMLRQHRREMQRRNRQSPPDFDGPPPRHRQGRPGFLPPGRGPAWNAPRNLEGQPEVCPFCHRPMGRELAPFGPRQRGQGFAPRRHFAPEDRGPGFGPPPWAGRGAPGGEVRPGPRGPRGPLDDGPPMQDRRLGPQGRGSNGPANPPPPDREDVRP